MSESAKNKLLWFVAVTGLGSSAVSTYMSRGASREAVCSGYTESLYIGPVGRADGDLVTLVFFGLLLAVLGGGRALERWRPGILRHLVYGLAIGGLVWALAVASILLRIREYAGCPLCLLSLGAIGAAFLISTTLNDVARGPGPPFWLKATATACGVLVPLTPATGMLSSWLRTPTANPTLIDRAAVRVWIDQQPRVDLPRVGDTPTTFVVFEDYQCPSCRRAFDNLHPALRQIQQKTPGALRVEYRDFPLEPECNPMVAVVLHSSACEAAVAARLATTVGRGEEMRAWLFANQRKLSREGITKALAETAGIRDFNERYATEVVGIKEDVALASQVGVSGTPAMFANGLRLPAGISGESLSAVISLLIEEDAARRAD